MMERWSGIIDKTFEDPSNVLDDDAGDIVMVTSMPLKYDSFNAFGLLVKTSHFRIVIGCDWILLQWSVLRALAIHCVTLDCTELRFTKTCTTCSGQINVGV